MNDVKWLDHGVVTRMKYQPSEDRMYVQKYGANEGAIKRLVEVANSHGGVKKNVDGLRLVRTIPEHYLVWADEGKLFDGKYKGFRSSADKNSREKLFASFLREPELKAYLYE